MIAEMIRPGAMAALIEDQFGNYVVQTALDQAQPEQRAQIIKEMMPYLNNIKSKTWYKRMMNKIGLGVNNGQFDSGRHPMGQRQFVDDNVHQRRTTEPRGLSPMQGYGNTHAPSRSVDQFPPGFMHGHPVGSDRNGYRGHQHAPSHSQAASQYGNNFYPAFNPRTPVHHSEYRGNGEY
jgi:Pumilio-family RNA binding repeat